MHKHCAQWHLLHTSMQCISLPLSTQVNNTGFVVNSKVQNSSTFQGPKLHFSSTKIIDKKRYPRRGYSKFRLQCDTLVYCTHQYCNDKSKISKFARFKFKDFSRIFKYFQAPYLFSSTSKGLEVFIPNSSIFKDFSTTL